MAKIELTAAEIKIIEAQLEKKVDTWTMTEEQKEAFGSALDKAIALMHEEEAYEAASFGLLQWFWDRYKSQE